MKKAIDFFIKSPIFVLVTFFAVNTLFLLLTFAARIFLAESYPIVSIVSVEIPYWLYTAILCLLILLNTLFVSQFIYVFSSQKTRGLLSAFVFMLLLVSFTNITTLALEVYLSLSFFILGLFQIFLMYSNSRAVEQAFTSGLFIGISALLLEPMLFVIPVCPFVFMINRSFSLKTFLAFFIGVFCAAVNYLAFSFFFLPDFSFENFFVLYLFETIKFTSPSIVYSIYLTAMFVFFIAYILGIVLKRNSMKNRTRRQTYIVFLFFCFFVFLNSFQREMQNVFFPFLLFFCSLYSSFIFYKNKSFFNVVLIFVFCLLNILFVLYNFM